MDPYPQHWSELCCSMIECVLFPQVPVVLCSNEGLELVSSPLASSLPSKPVFSIDKERSQIWRTGTSGLHVLHQENNGYLSRRIRSDPHREVLKVPNPEKSASYPVWRIRDPGPF